MIMVLVIGGFFRSLQFTCINTIAYADIDKRRMSRATSLVSVGQQLSISTGVAVAALVVEMTLRFSRSPGHHCGGFSAGVPYCRSDFGLGHVDLRAACAGRRRRTRRPHARPDRTRGSADGVTEADRQHVQLR